MTTEIRSIFVTLPAEEARQRWERSGAATAGLVLTPDRRAVDLHFIPATGGCVIAAVPKAPVPAAVAVMMSWPAVVEDTTVPV